MVLVYDDSLARLHWIRDSTVSRSSIQYTIVIMFSYFQPLDGLQSDSVATSEASGPKPTVHNARIGELFQYRNFSITYGGGAHSKDLSSAHNSASADTESIWVQSQTPLKNEFHVFLRSYFDYIAPDSPVIDNRLTPRQNAVTSRRTFSTLCKLCSVPMPCASGVVRLLGMIPPRILVRP